MKLITIITPVYNVEDYIEECILSILNQLYKNIELILIDDGSSDNSGGICDKYASLDDRIHVIHQTNSGVSVARNVGLKNSNGSYISFVDPDDIVEIDIYTTLVKIIEEHEVDCVCCSYYSLSDKGKESKKCWNGVAIGIEAFKVLLQEDFYTTSVWNKFFRRDAIILKNSFMAFQEGLTVGEDEKWLMDILCGSNISIKFIDTPLYIWRIRENSAIRGTYNGMTMQKIDSVAVQENILKSLLHYNDKKLNHLLSMKIYKTTFPICKNCYLAHDDDILRIYFSKLKSGRFFWYYNNLNFVTLKKIIWEIRIFIYLLFSH